MMNRAALLDLGGWGLVAERICEDLVLAKFAKRAGLRLGMDCSAGFAADAHVRQGAGLLERVEPDFHRWAFDG